MNMKDKMKQKENLLGIFLSEIAHPNLIRLIQAAGADFVVVDCEHGYFDYSQVAALAAIGRGIEFPVIVRMPGISRDYIQKYLDAGVDGLWVPMVETKEQAEELVKLSRYAPEGKRGISTMRPHSNYNPGDLKTYMASANAHILLFAQIETQKGADHAGEITSVKGLDGIFIGPNDLACDLGEAGGFDTPQMNAAIHKILTAAKNSGLPCGMVASNPVFLQKWAAEGMHLFSCDSELGLLKKGIQSMLRDVALH